MCEKSFSSPSSLRLNADGTTVRFQPTTQWMPVASYRSWSFNLLMRAEVGSMRARPAVQLAEIRADNPDDPIALGSFDTTAGHHYQAPSLVDVTKRMYWRFGIQYSSSNSAVAEADLGLNVQYDSVGKVLRPTSVQIQPISSSSSDVSLHTVSGWSPAIVADHMKAAVVVQSSQNKNLDVALFRRVANDPNSPSQWSQVSGWEDTNTGNTEIIVGQSDLSVGSHSWVQLGLGTRTTGDPARATCHVLPAIY